MYAASRTKWFDEFFIAAGANGIDQAVILAAGLDARGWRLPWVDGTRSPEDTLMYVRVATQQFASNQGYECGIWWRGELAGTIGNHRIDWRNRATSIGYWLGEAYQGKGLEAGGRLERVIWDEFAGDRERLAGIAEAIRKFYLSVDRCNSNLAFAEQHVVPRER